jgi:uncharacterized PurR-regulated membrane protein YhhQ (DUF165 family)
LLFILVPIGILVGQLTHEMFAMEDATASVTFSFIFGGIALALAHFLSLKGEKEHNL